MHLSLLSSYLCLFISCRSSSVLIRSCYLLVFLGVENLERCRELPCPLSSSSWKLLFCHVFWEHTTCYTKGKISSYWNQREVCTDFTRKKSFESLTWFNPERTALWIWLSTYCNNCSDNLYLPFHKLTLSSRVMWLPVRWRLSDSGDVKDENLWPSVPPP